MSTSAAIPIRPGLEQESRATGIDMLPFSDLYVNIDRDDGHAIYRLGPNPQGKTGNVPVPPEYALHLRGICTQIGNSDSLSGVITVDDMRLRYQKRRMADGEWRAAIRRIEAIPPRLVDLNAHQEATAALRQWGRQSGLLVIGGQTGVGKTTTAVSILCEYLEHLGGNAVTIEDPPEYLLQGPIGTRGGHCDQMEIHGDAEWEEATNAALRWRPRFIFYGEIRSPEAAAQALRASSSGHLIITTAHGGSIPDTISTVMRRAEVLMGPAARPLMADNLIGVVQQKFGPYGPNVEILSIPRGGQNAEETPLRKILASDGDVGLRQQSLKAYVKKWAAEA